MMHMLFGFKLRIGGACRVEPEVNRAFDPTFDAVGPFLPREESSLPKPPPAQLDR